MILSSPENTFEIEITAYKPSKSLIINLLQDAIQSFATNIIILSIVIDTQIIFAHRNLYGESNFVHLLKKFS